MTEQQVIALQAFIVTAVRHQTSCVHDQQRVTLQDMVEAQAYMLEVFKEQPPQHTAERSSNSISERIP